MTVPMFLNKYSNSDRMLFKKKVLTRITLLANNIRHFLGKLLY